jgi:hypothetical protein
MDTRRAVGATRVLMNRLDALIQCDVLAVALRQTTAPPGIVARARDAQDAAEGGDRSNSLISGYELEDSPGSE